MHFEKGPLLSKLIELWVTVEETGRDELVKNPHHDRGKKGEEDVVEGERPRFVDHLTRKGVLERILASMFSLGMLSPGKWGVDVPRTVSCIRQCSYKRNIK